jgi:hypothetical protein
MQQIEDASGRGDQQVRNHTIDKSRRHMPSGRANGPELRQPDVVTAGGMLWLARKTLSGS